jgi:hypothetical protein
MTTPNPQVQAYKTLHESKVFLGVLRRARKIGKVQYFVTEVEKYNHEYGQNWELIPDHQSKRPYDVEGHCCSDIQGFYDGPNLLTLSGIWDFISGIGGWIKDSVELRSWSFFFETIPFFMPWGQWVWTIDSLQITAQEIIEHEERDRLWETGDRSTKALMKVMDESRSKALKLSHDELMELLKKDGYIQMSNGIFVTPQDPTVFCVDETVIPFDLKDGWSNWMLGKILREWFRDFGHPFPVSEAHTHDEPQKLKHFLKQFIPGSKSW